MSESVGDTWDVVVVGAGAAGASAAWAACRAGARVVVVHGAAGGTALGSGALDLEPWSETRPTALGADTTVAFAVALEVWKVGPEAVRVATQSGVPRPAAGRDRALLNLAAFAGRSIAVADTMHVDWDGKLLARALNDSDWARQSHTSFEALAVPDLLTEDERHMPSFDLARRFDEPSRVRAARAALSAAAGAESHAAWLVGPWLGIESDAAGSLSEALERPVGETTSLPGGAAGGRFEWARDRLLRDLGAAVEVGRVLVVEPEGSCFRIGLDGRDVRGRRVVLALGGVLAGGIRLGRARPTQPEDQAFHLSADAPVSLELDSLPVDRLSTLYGLDFFARGVDVLSRVGIVSDGVLARGSAHLFVAGDCVAARPRTVLEAVRAGALAGTAAARSLG